MEKMEPTIEKEMESDRELRLPESGRESDWVFENSAERSQKAITRKEALCELHELVGRDQRYDMDGDEIRRISELLDHIDSRDAFLLLKAAETTNTLKEGSFEEMALNFTKEASELLEKIYSRTRSYLVKSWIDSVLESPEKDWTLEQKEDFLREYSVRGEVCSYINMEHPEWGKYLWKIRQGNTLNIPDEDKEKIFNSFLQDRFTVFDHMRRRKMYERFYIPRLSKRYWLPLPKIPEGYVQEIPSEVGRIVGKASREYGIVYNPQFTVEYFFHRDVGLENQESAETTKIISQKMTVEDMLREEGFSGSDEEMQKFSELYRMLMEPFFRSKIEDEFLIRLEDFSVRTQVQFLNFLFEKSEEEVARVRKFLRAELHFGNYPFGPKSRGADFVRQSVRDGFLDVAREERKNRLKSFLSLEQGGEEMGEKILAIGEKLPKEAADRVFAKYAELSEGARSLEKTLSQYYPEQNHEEHVQNIGKQLLDRARNLLIQFSLLDADVDESVLLERLSREQAGIAVFLAIHKTMRKEGKLPILAELPGVNFQVMTNRDLSADQETLQKMRTVYAENYSAYPKEFREKVVGSLDERVWKDTVFYLLWKDGSLLAFDAFTRQDDNTLSFGAFNITPEAQGHALADGMLEATLLKHGKKQNIVAECDARKPISKKYIEYGFAVKDIYTAHFPDGNVPILSIERRKSGEALYRESDRNYERKDLTVSIRECEEVLQPLLLEGFVITCYDNSDLEHIVCTLERSAAESN